MYNYSWIIYIIVTSILFLGHGFVYVSGSNSYGQLGLSYVKDRVTTPSLISSKVGPMLN